MNLKEKKKQKGLTRLEKNRRGRRERGGGRRGEEENTKEGNTKELLTERERGVGVGNTKEEVK